jgi:hypothetical protein
MVLIVSRDVVIARSEIPEHFQQDTPNPGIRFV